VFLPFLGYGKNECDLHKRPLLVKISAKSFELLCDSPIFISDLFILMNVHTMTPSVGFFSGEDSGLLHIIDISVPESPRITATHVFSPSGDGKPRDVAVCGTEICLTTNQQFFSKFSMK
jgi:hypothetical protein